MSLLKSRTWSDLLPGWLSEGPGRDFLDAWIVVLDVLMSGVDDARMGFLDVFGDDVAADAPPLVAKDRNIPPGFFESAKQYLQRASLWRQIWEASGRPRVILGMVAAVWGPSPPKMRLVRNFGWASGPASAKWTTREANGTFSDHVETPTNFPWDGVNKSHRAWLVIYVPAVLANAQEGTFDDETSTFGETAMRPDGTLDKPTIGTTAFLEYVTRTREVLDLFKPAHVLIEWIIIAFDPDSFDPTAPAGTPGMPDDTWGTDSKIVADQCVLTRNQTARYWKGV
jgi:hypothetical protein